MKKTNQLAECAWIHKKMCNLDGKCSICPHAREFINIVKNGVLEYQEKYFIKMFGIYYEIWEKNNEQK